MDLWIFQSLVFYMSNILYIGPYREFSSDGNISRHYIKALLAAGHNLSIKPIYNIFKSYPEQEIHKEILDLEKNSSNKYHSVIQHCYPHQYYTDRRFDNNIGILNLESFNYHDRLIDFLKIPNKLIAPSNYAKFCADEFGRHKLNIEVIPPPIDIDQIKNYRRNHTKDIDNKLFTFYVIEDFVNKSNLSILLEAFWLSVDNEDDINIVIKTKNKNQEHTDLYQTIEYEFGRLGSMVSKFNKKPKIVIGEIKNDAMYYFHNNNSCYVDVSSGKNFGYSVLEALAFENPIITLENAAQSEIIKETNNFTVESEITYCKDESKNYNIYNTIDQRWYVPNLQNLIEQINNVVHEDRSHKIERIKLSRAKIAEKYSINAVVDLLKNYDI